MTSDDCPHCRNGFVFDPAARRGSHDQHRGTYVRCPACGGRGQRIYRYPMDSRLYVRAGRSAGGDRDLYEPADPPHGVPLPGTVLRLGRGDARPSYVVLEPDRLARIRTARPGGERRP